jgi:hypothetical protein
MQVSVAWTPHLRRVGNALAVASVAAILYATLLPDTGEPVNSHLCIVCGSRGGVDTILNVLLFMPLGVGLALSGLPWGRGVMTACVISLMVETTQFFFIPGRDATLGDLLTNTIGGALGFAIARCVGSWMRPAPRTAAIVCLGWCAVWLTIQAISSFSFAPSIPNSGYYGQIARQLGGFALFPGKVLDPKIGDVTITDKRFRDIDSVGRRLLGGAKVALTALPAGRTSGIAPIVRVADDEQREIVLLAQDDDAFLFGVRTGSAVLRLRSALFAMPRVFPDGVGQPKASPSEPITLSANYDGAEAQLTARARSVSRHQTIPVSSALGWTLALPFQWYIENTRTEMVVSWIWMACLTLPIGYWGAHTALGTDPRRRLLIAVLCFLAGVAILIAGLVRVQYAIGLPAAPLRDWIAAMSGIVSGGAIGLRVGNVIRQREPGMLDSGPRQGDVIVVGTVARAAGGLSLNSKLR